MPSLLRNIEYSGIRGFNLASTGIHNHGNDQTVQIAVAFHDVASAAVDRWKISDVAGNHC